MSLTTWSGVKRIAADSARDQGGLAVIAYYLHSTVAAFGTLRATGTVLNGLRYTGTLL